MAEGHQKKKKTQGMTILSSKKSKGHGAGLMDMSNISSVIVDETENEAYIDKGALHAKSKVERRIKFKTEREDMPNGKPYWIVWVAVDRQEAGPYYAGVTACYMEIDHETRHGFKRLNEHVNRMDYAMKGRIHVDDMGDHAKTLLRDFLQEHSAEMWENAGDELKQAL